MGFMIMGFILVSILTIVFLITITAIFFGDRYWQTGTHTLRKRLTPQSSSTEPLVYDPQELENLPEPVKRYFETVLTPGQPMIVGMKASHTGYFSLSETEPKWVPFRSDQWSTMHPIGFDWDGRIRMAPGIKCFVHDAYIAGEGLLHATLLGLIPLAKLQGTPEVAQGELLRFLAEAAWYPTALLPSQGVSWEAINDRSAHASLTDGETTVTLEFRFDEDHLIEGIYTPSRYRTVHGKLSAMPWEGKIWNYERHDGMLIPIDGEIAWKLPEGTLPYWRGHVSKINYEFTS
jgi:hypothetical protein